ncbi:hypothetical protein EV714DRAFT_248341, partial [Schizophyllum commune]
MSGVVLFALRIFLSGLAVYVHRHAFSLSGIRFPFVLAVTSSLPSQWSFSFQLSQLQVFHSTRALTLRFALATYALHIFDVFRRQQCFR